MLLVERPARGVFGGIWAFPGGAIEPGDHDVTRFGFADPWRAAAMRETAEEVDIFLTDHPVLPGGPVDDVVATVAFAGARFDPGRLRYLASWVTPVGVPRRFDARFYLAEVPGDVEGRVVTDELVDMAWVEPAVVLERVRSGVWSMIFPTTWHVELVAASDEPMTLPPHPRRQLVTVHEPFEIIDFGIPEGEEAS